MLASFGTVFDICPREHKNSFDESSGFCRVYMGKTGVFLARSASELVP
jgi:hypothetical protein